MAARIKKGDQVVVISGKDKGTRGAVLKVLPEQLRVIVEGVNKVKRHQKPTPRFQTGGIVEKENSIAMSKVMILDTKADKPSRVRMQTDAEGNKVRVAVKSGSVIDG